MSDPHEPDPQFLEHLRWQVATEARRRERLGFDTPAPIQGGRWKAAALLLAGLTLGTAGTVAAGELGRRQDRAELLAEVAIEIRLAETERSLLADQEARLEQLVASGLAPKERLAETEQETLAATNHLNILELDKVEIRASGASPDRRLSAPLVGGRDFVLERLVAAEATLQGAIQLCSSATNVTRARYESGMGSITGAQGAELDLALAQQDLARSSARRDLRARWAKGDLSALQIRLAERLVKTRWTKAKLSLCLSQATLSAELHQQHVAAGFASQDPKAELELARFLARHDLIELQLKSLLRDCQGLPDDLLKGEAKAGIAEDKALAPPSKGRR